MKKPGLSKRLRAAARLIFGSYEGARFTDLRSWLWGGVHDASKDITKSTRLELVRKSRYFEKNSGLANKLGLIFEQYVVGRDGLIVTPATSSPEFNTAATDFWNESQRYIDIQSTAGFGSLQGKTAWRWFFDGESFWFKTRSSSSGRARLQLIESHRIVTPENLKERDDVSDGVQFEKTTGRPLFYFIDGKPVSASLLIPIMEQSRANQFRSLPFLTPVLQLLHDLNDLSDLEMRNAKAHAAHNALFVANEAGEGDIEDLLRQGESIVNGDSVSGQDSEARTKYYSDVLGGRIIFGKQGDSIHSVGNNNPSAAQQWFHDYTISAICAGVGISKLLVYPWSIQGTVTRADLDSQAVYFGARSEIMAVAVRSAYEYIIAEAVKSNILKNAPKDYLKSHVRPPRCVNVDVGYNSAAVLAELNSGTRTFQQVFSDLGLDWRTELTQKADEAEFILKLAQDRNLKPEQISNIVTESLKQNENQMQ